jgi:hypothetical protein
MSFFFFFFDILDEYFDKSTIEYNFMSNKYQGLFFTENKLIFFFKKIKIGKSPYSFLNHYSIYNISKTFN